MMEIPRNANKRSILLKIFVVALIAAIAVLSTSMFYRNKYNKLLAISAAMDVVETNYYFYDEKTDLTTLALRGIAANIGDNYSQYYTEEEYKQLLASNSGNYIGVGISVIDRGDGSYYINAVFDNTPASEAGIMVDDRIITINGVSYEGLSMSDFLDYFSHDDGAVNIIAVERGGEVIEYTLTMREVYSPYVEHKMLDNGIGYILIKGFQGKCVSEVDAAIEELNSKGMTKLVLDLRDNLGGSLYDVNDIAGKFLPKGSLITTVKSRTDSEQAYLTETEGISVPIALLVNNYSASASELLAGALHDHGAARLFGQVTYGKGIVQTYYHLGNGLGYFKLTSDAYYTPNGVCIQGTGIEPDVEVALSDEWVNTAISLIPQDEDAQLIAAIDYLKNLG